MKHSIGKMADVKSKKEEGFVRRTGDLVSIPGNYQYRALYEGYTVQRFWHYAKILEAERWLDPRDGDVILDVGCGSNVLAARLAENPGTKVIGIDSNRNAIMFATKHFLRPNLQFRLGLADEISPGVEYVTKIAFMEVIEHISSDQALNVLKTFYKLLAKSGRLVIFTPNAKSLWPIIQWVLDRAKIIPNMGMDQHVILYDLRSLKLLAEKVGFRIIAYRSLHAIAPWVSALNWKIALGVHRLEQLRPHLLGSLLLVTLEKGNH